jgi:hypothetical protein
MKSAVACTAGGKRLSRTLLSRISDPETGHHSIAGHVKHFATVCFSGAREHAEKLVEQRQHSRRRQCFGKSGITSHVRE